MPPAVVPNAGKPAVVARFPAHAHVVSSTRPSAPPVANQRRSRSSRAKTDPSIAATASRSNAPPVRRAAVTAAAAAAVAAIAGAAAAAEIGATATVVATGASAGKRCSPCATVDSLASYNARNQQKPEQRRREYHVFAAFLFPGQSAHPESYTRIQQRSAGNKQRPTTVLSPGQGAVSGRLPGLLSRHLDPDVDHPDGQREPTGEQGDPGTHADQKQRHAIGNPFVSPWRCMIMGSLCREKQPGQRARQIPKMPGPGVCALHSPGRFEIARFAEMSHRMFRPLVKAADDSKDEKGADRALQAHPPEGIFFPGCRPSNNREVRASGSSSQRRVIEA